MVHTRIIDKGIKNLTIISNISSLELLNKDLQAVTYWKYLCNNSTYAQRRSDFSPNDLSFLPWTLG